MIKVEENYKNELFAGDKIVKVNGRTDIDVEYIIKHECTLTIERLVNFKIRVIHAENWVNVPLGKQLLWYSELRE